MATKFFLRHDSWGNISIIPSFNARAATLVAGSGGSNQITDTVDSGNHIGVTVTSGENPQAWIIKVPAVTISGTISVSLVMAESAMTVNAQAAIRISRYDYAGNFISDIVSTGNANHADGVELSTSATAMTWTITPTNTTLVDGDLIVIFPHVDGIGITMNAGTATFVTATTTVDTSVTFNENFTMLGQGYGQAQAYIKLIRNGYGQAAAQIDGSSADFTDPFTRSTSNSWGGSWTPLGSDLSLLSTDGDEALISRVSSNLGVESILKSVSFKNVEGKVDFKFSNSTIPEDIYFTLRASGGGSTYLGYQNFPSENIRISSDLSGVVDIRYSNGVLVSDVITLSSNIYYTFKFQILDAPDNTVHYRAKIWQTDQSEPADWYSIKDTKFSNNSGHVRLFSSQTNSATQTITFDNFNLKQMILAGFGQAQATIAGGTPVVRGYAQAQAAILQTYNSFAQSQADILQTYNSFAQAQANILQTYNSYAQAQANIKQTYNSFAQAQATIKATYNSFAQAQGSILQVYNAFAQAQADILQTYNAFAQAQAAIEQTYNVFAQSQANILQTYNSFAQAQAKINAFDVEAFAQAQAFILNAIAVHGQAQADILQTYNSFAQAQADILQIYQGYAQAQASILQTYQGYGQAQASIKQTYSSFAQSQADIKQTYNSFAQAQASILQIYQSYANAQANILQTYQAYANAQAKIIQTYNAYAQAQASILAVSNSYAQAQADILQTYNSFAQAQASILQVYQSYAQAQAAILTTYQSYAQAQADILQVYQGYAQAQATILQVYQGYGQAQAAILTTYNSFAQAQASIKTTYQSYGQAQALIYIAQYLRPIADITTNAWERVVI